MKKDLLNILVCPVCKGKLTLTIQKEMEREIVSGNLFCGNCKVNYPIENTIPKLLPPEKKT
ncbi:MAG: methytransferase partner Trm112 [Dehalococcoidales bacterium]|nr:methytransferase partner Trm112 [Dehalococcoidales bacterium]